MPTTDREASRRADARCNHAALLSAAARLYAEHGLGVTYEEIAQAAGVGRATLYRHFPTRELLLAAIMDSMLDELTAVAERLPATPDRCFALLQAAFRLQERNLPLVDLVSDAVPEEHRRHSRRRLEDLFRAPLRDAQDAGLIRSDLGAGDVRIVLLMLSSLARGTVRGPDRRRAAALVRLILEPPAQPR